MHFSHLEISILIYPSHEMTDFSVDNLHTVLFSAISDSFTTDLLPTNEATGAAATGAAATGAATGTGTGTGTGTPPKPKPKPSGPPQPKPRPPKPSGPNLLNPKPKPNLPPQNWASACCATKTIARMTQTFENCILFVYLCVCVNYG